MAFTVSNVMNTTMGDAKVAILRVTPDAATQAIDTGFNVLKYVTLSYEVPASHSLSSFPVLKINANASGVAANGQVGLSACISGEVLVLTCYAPA